MPLGTNHLQNSATSVQEFVPELWSDDVVAAYKQNLVMAGLVSKINHVGKRGDVIHIPKPTRGSANAKAVQTQVTLNQNNSSEILVNINRHFEYSIIIEDILAVQALASLRRFHTDDAGYALAKQVDTDLIQLGRGVQGGDGTNNYTAGVIGGDGSTAYTSAVPNATDLTDAGIRRAIQTLDDNDVPMSNRYLLITPGQKNVLLGINRFTEQAFVGEVGQGNSIRNGRVGDIYGVDVYVSTNADTASGNSAGGGAADRVNLLFHKDAFVLAEQMSVRTQAQYKQEWLGTLLTADTIYGVAELRNEAAVALVTPS